MPLITDRNPHVDISREKLYVGTDLFLPIAPQNLKSDDGGFSFYELSGVIMTVSSRIAVSIVPSLCLLSSVFAQNSFWNQTNGPLDGQVVALSTGGDAIYAATHNNLTFGGGVYRSINSGLSWDSTGLMNPLVRSLLSHGEIVIAGTDDDIYRSTNGGLTWQRVTPVFPGGLPLINDLAIDSSDVMLAATQYDVYGSTDDGATWSRMYVRSAYTSVYALVVTPAGHIYAGTINGYIFRSTDGGQQWVSVASHIGQYYISSLAVNSAGHVFASSNAGIIVRSTDSGTSWDTVYQTFMVSDMITDRTGSIYAATQLSVFRSTNDGATWDTLDSGLPSELGFGVNGFGSDATGYIYAGATDGNVYRSAYPISGLTVDKSVSPYQLLDNYPNPFNPSTTIRYSLPHSSQVTLAVYNLLGQEVARLVNERQQAGYHETLFSGDGLASGMYFCRLDAGSFTSVKKLLLLK